MKDIPVIRFAYNVENILQEAHKRTSKFGQMRTDDSGSHLLDRLSLTDGENYLREEFFDDAIHQTYDWLMPFARRINNAIETKLTYTTRTEFEHCGITVKKGTSEPQEVIPYSTYSDFMDIPAIAQKYNNNTVRIINSNPFNNQYIVFAKINTSYKLEYRCTLNTTLRGMACQEHFSEIVNCSVNANEYLGFYTSLSFPFNFVEHGDEHQIVSATMEVKVMDIHPTNTVAYIKGDYVEYTDENSIMYLYEISDNCTNQNWKEHARLLDYDPRGSIVFTLEKGKLYDDNMYGSVERYIREAIVNYVIYRWFEYTKADECDAFYGKFESYAKQARNSLETKIGQKRYKLF